MKTPLNILITTGDPRGVGPEVTKKALEDPHIKKLANFFIIEPDDKTGFSAVREAVRLLREGRAQGLVTAPLNKLAVNKQGIPFKGHTEYLAGVTHTEKFTMFFCGGPLKVSLVTRHEPLRRVAQCLTQKKIEQAILLTDAALKRYFGIRCPKIGICGLNPHSGEGGFTGMEEKKIIIPAIKKATSKARGIKGPLASDVAFYLSYKGELDAVVAMYHDQGLGPFKMITFERGVNVTLGLPFIRTSPDHGTAYDIAGRGIADPTSMKEAIKLAESMCRKGVIR